MIIPYKQVLPDTCLPTCLMMFLAHLKKIDKPSFTLESKILIEGGKIGRLNRTFGHLFYVSKRFDARALYVAEKRWLFEEARKIKARKDSTQIKIKKQTINLDLIERKLSLAPVILGVDNYVFNKDFHFPHFVLVEKIENQKFQLIEPWQGKRLWIAKSTLKKAVNSLEATTFYWKELIQLYS